MHILIVDDHALFREGLCHVLHTLDEDAAIIEASDYDGTLQQLAAETEMDLVLLDLHLPGRNGFDILQAIVRQYPALPVVILSGSTQRSDMQRAINLGARGFIPKDSSSAIMLSALRLILSGGIYVPQTAKQVSGQETELTRRQRDVLELMVKGMSNKEIGLALDLMEATVKMHVSTIFKILNVSNRTQAAMLAERLGLVASTNSN